MIDLRTVTMIDGRFDHIVSLGSHCEMTYHIRRRFDCRVTQLFDWLVTPTRALVDIIENDFAGLAREENMRVIFDGDGVLCERYGTVHYHDFLDAKPDGKYLLDLVQRDCPKIRDKFAALAGRFRSLRGRVLFVRLDQGIVYQGDRNGDFDDVLYHRLTTAIERLLPDLDYRLLFLRSTYHAEHPRLHFDTVERYGDATWKGSDKGWDEMFARHRIVLAPEIRRDDIARIHPAPVKQPAKINAARPARSSRTKRATG